MCSRCAHAVGDSVFKYGTTCACVFHPACAGETCPTHKFSLATHDPSRDCVVPECKTRCVNGVCTNCARRFQGCVKAAIGNDGAALPTIFESISSMRRFWPPGIVGTGNGLVASDGTMSRGVHPLFARGWAWILNLIRTHPGFSLVDGKAWLTHRWICHCILKQNMTIVRFADIDEPQDKIKEFKIALIAGGCPELIRVGAHAVRRRTELNCVTPQLLYQRIVDAGHAGVPCDLLYAESPSMPAWIDSEIKRGRVVCANRRVYPAYAPNVKVDADPSFKALLS